MDVLEKSFNNLAQIGMVKVYENGVPVYKTDETDFRIKTDRLSEFVNGNPDNPLFQNLKRSLDQFIEDMLVLRISEDSLEQYLRTNKENADIRMYKQIKNKLRFAIVSVTKHGENHQDAARYEFQSVKHVRQRDARKVLNKHNPFADITIANQQFLYKDPDGEYKTLAFTTGHTLTKLTTNDTEVLAMQPGFKISKTNDRKPVYNQMEVVMDDTITTPLPETNGEAELIYI